MAFPYAEQVTWHVWASTAEDDHGNDVPAFTDRTLDVALWPTTSDESVAEVATGSYTLTTLDATAVGSQDEFTARGVRWRVQGDAELFHSALTGTEVTRVILLRRT